MQIYLLEITAAVDAAGTLQTLRFAESPGYNHPSGAGYYEPRLVQPANVRRSLIAALTTFGQSEINFGELVLDNTDGGLDVLRGYGYGRAAVLKLGDHESDISSFVTVLSGVVEQAEVSLNQVTLLFRDRTQELDLPLQPSKFAGTNSGTSGIEGTQSDLKGKPKPRVWGKVRNVTPIALNTSAQIWGVNFDRAGATVAIASVDAVRVNGAAWSFGSNRANLAALQAASPAQGVYDTCLAEGLIKLGGTLDGLVTVDVTEGDTTNRKVAYLIKRILLDAGVASGDVSSADITALDTACPYVAGVFADAETTPRALLNAVLQSVGAFAVPDRLGVYRIGQIKAPSGAAALTFMRFVQGAATKATDADIISIERVISRDDGRGVPAWKVNLNYRRMWTVQGAGSMAGSLSEADRALYGTATRTVSAEDVDVKDQFLQSPEINIETVLDVEADAQAECDRRQTLYGVLRDIYRVKAALSEDLADAIDLGATVELKLSRFGLSAGKLFTVIGDDYDAKNRIVELDLWG